MKQWYLIVYDISDPKRLAKVHRVISKRGLAAQRSVFFVYGSSTAVQAIWTQLTTLIEPIEDDLRAYPVNHPGDVWSSGQRAVTFPLLKPNAKKPEKTAINTPKQQLTKWLNMLRKYL